jgi:hypothetical protein
MPKASISLAIAVSILFFPTIGFSQMLLDWANAYPTSTYPANTHLAMDRSGDIYVAGNTGGDHAYTLIKYNSAGVQQWGFEGPPGSSQPYDGVTGIAIDAYGNVYLVNNGDYGIEVDALNASGSQLYRTLLTFSGQYADARVMTADAWGNVYIGGQTLSASTNIWSFMTIRVSGGVLSWMSTFQASANRQSLVTGILADGAGNVYVTGTGYGAHGYVTFLNVPSRLPIAIIRYDTSMDIITIKYDTSGNATWTNTYNGGYGVSDVSYQITQDPSSANLYVTGQSTSGTDAVSDLIAYSAAGAQLWATTNNDASTNQGVAVDPSGNIFTAGFTNPGYNGFNVSKYTSVGSLSWSYSNPAVLSGNAIGRSQFPMALDRQGNCYLTGMGSSFTGFNTVEISSTGLLVWSAPYPTPQVISDDAITVFTPILRFGQIGIPRIIVTGSVFSTGFTTLQYEYHPVNDAYRADSINGSTTGFPGEFTAGLSNFPNPFRGATTITYTIPNDSHVAIRVFDQSGHTITALFDGNQNAGSYTLPFTANRLAPGIYHYQIIATSSQGKFIQTKQMLIL